MTECAVPMLLEPALKSAVGSAVGALVKRAIDRSPVKRHKSHHEIFEDASRSAGRSLLPLVDELPPKVSLSDVARVLNGLETAQTIREMIYLQLSIPDSPLKAVLVKRLALHASRLGEWEIEFSSKVATHVQEYVVYSAESLVKELRAADATGKLHEYVISDSILTATIARSPQLDNSRKRFANPDAYEELLEWERDYRNAVANDHGNLEPPDAEMKRKVPIERLYVASSLSSPDIDLGADIDSTQLMSISDRVILLGDPGGGKSTAARYLSQAHARNGSARVPFTVVLRDFASGGVINKSIVEYLEEQARALYQTPAPAYGVEYLLSSGRALVIFDGLDELVKTEDRREVTRRVELFLTMHPAVTALVTSRRVGYDQARLDPTQFDVVHLEGFDADAVRSYVVKWFEVVVGLSGADLERDVESFMVESEGLPDLTINPLMLALMCIIYRGQGYLPRNRTDVYEQCAKLLFEKWDTSRKIHVELKARSQVDSAIKHLAFWLLSQRGGAEAVTERELLAETSKYLEGVFSDGDECKAAAVEFVEFCTGRAWVFSDAGTTGSGERLFKFTHRTFMEFFAAYQITRLHDTPEQIAKLLLPRIASDEWEVIAQLVVQLAHKHVDKGGDRIVKKLLDLGRRRKLETRERIHSFVWTCLAFIVVHPSIARDLVRSSTADSITTLVLNSENTHRVRFIRGDLDFGSIAYSIGVLPEVRAEVVDPILLAIENEVNGPDPLRARVGAIVVLSGLLTLRNVPVEARLSWQRSFKDWAREHLTVLLEVSGQTGRFFALTRGLLSLSAVLELEGSMAAFYRALHRDEFVECYAGRFVSWSGIIWRAVIVGDSDISDETRSGISELEELVTAEACLELENVLDSISLHAMHEFLPEVGSRKDLPEWALFLALAPLVEWQSRRSSGTDGGGDRRTMMRAIMGDVLQDSLMTEGRAEVVAAWAAGNFSFVQPDAEMSYR